MIAGRGTVDQLPARLFAYRHPLAFAELIDRLVEASADYLVRQFEAGADAVQIFDTWAGILEPRPFSNFEPDALTERMRHHQDVGKYDRREANPRDGL